MRPSIAEGGSPASASARSTASAAISFGLRPEARVCADSPTPTMAISPAMSSRGVGQPQSLSATARTLSPRVAPGSSVAPTRPPRDRVSFSA